MTRRTLSAHRARLLKKRVCSSTAHKIRSGTTNSLSNNSTRPGRPSPFTPSSFPFAVDALADGSKVYVSSQRDGGLYSINLSNLAAPVTTFIKTGIQTGLVGGSHPVSLIDDRKVTTPAGLLYAANAGDDSVSVINTANDAVVKTISVRPQGTSAATLPGVTPTGLALSADGATLYATLADMNAVAVVGTAAGTVTGAIPVGWYPTSVVVGKNSNLLVANAKGVVSANPNPQHVEPLKGAANQYEDTYYDQSIIEGTVSNITLPDAATLTNQTAQVIANNVTALGADTLSQIGLGGTGQIKHVIYIVKENRTYDQVLGDVAAGNGDSTLAVFGKSVTPNLHAIVNQFALFDNFYDCAKVSGDGWNWSTEAMASEYVIRNLPYQYSSRGRSYDFEGQVNGYPVGGFPAKSPEGIQNSRIFPNGAPVVPDVDTPPAGYIWDNAENHGLSFRNYGFFLTGFESSIGKSIVPDNYPTEPGLKPGGHYTGGALDPNVNGHSDLDFRQFDTDYADSDAPTTNGNNAPYPRQTFGKFNAKNRFQEWNREFQAMLAADATGAAVPNLMTIKFMSDHTAGYSTGKPTPTAHVADNDYAVAELVDAVSHSPIWNSTAIFVIEDDAQAGPDHVDCHRSTCYVISPYVTPNTVDHTFHNTSSVVKSIELLLGLPMMNQYDAYAPSFGPDFGTNPSPAKYTALTESAANATQTASAAFLKAHPAYKYLVALTKKMNFSKEDLAPAQLLNEVIWKSVKGINSKMPAPRHGVIPVRATAKTGAKAAKTPARDGDD